MGYWPDDNVGNKTSVFDITSPNLVYVRYFPSCNSIYLCVIHIEKQDEFIFIFDLLRYKM